MVHGGSDIAYPVSFSEEFEQMLSDADVDVCMRVIENAPHFASMTHPEEYVFVLWIDLCLLC